MILILGLGNPGEKYQHTRHNVGFLFLDFLRESWRFPAFAPSNRFESILSKGEWGGHQILLGKPETYMNLSGKPAESLLRYYKLNEENLAVIHDDLDIAKGSLRSTHSSSPAGHNGVTDIIERIGTQDFFRIRIGIGRSEEDIPTKDFVLLPLSHEEFATLHDSTFPHAKELLEEWMMKQHSKLTSCGFTS